MCPLPGLGKGTKYDWEATYGKQLSRLVFQVPVSHPNSGLDPSHSYLPGPSDQFHPGRHRTRTLEHPPPWRGMSCPLEPSPGQTGTKLLFSPGCGASSSFPALPCGGAAPLRADCLAPWRYYGPLPLCSLFGVPSPGLQHAASGHRPTLCQWKDLSLRSRSGIYRGGPRPLFSSPLPLDPVPISGRFPDALSRRYPSGPDFLSRRDRRAIYLW